MGYESFEPLEATEETKLSAFQNELFINNPKDTDLMPKIRFTTDADEAAEAANADRSNPFDLPDSVFYVEPKEGAKDEPKTEQASETSFQNDVIDVNVSDSKFQNEPLDIVVTPQEIEALEQEAKDAANQSAERYVGPSSTALDIKIESAVRSLTLAQERLNEAIASGNGVMTAMHAVDSAQKLVDTYTQMYNTAVNAEARQAAGLMGSASDMQSGVSGDANTQVKFGSLAVDRAQFELENAYNSGNKIRIQNAERHLAHEKAKEAAKK